MSVPTPLKRIADFEQLGFGMFVHWGLYSQLERAEWIRHYEDIPYEEYKKLFNTFTAEDFDAVRITRKGMDIASELIALFL